MRGEDGDNGLCRMHVQVNAVKYESEQMSIFPGINCFLIKICLLWIWTLFFHAIQSVMQWSKRLLQV